MADLRTNFVGIKSPNPFWLASAPPTDKEYNVVRAFKAGWGGVVWKTLGEDPPIVNVAGPRYGAIHAGDRRLIGLNNIELITDRPLEVNLQRDQAGQARLAGPRARRLADGALRGAELDGDPAGRRGDRRDGVELNFGCPHGMSERGMGSAVGQVPEYIEMVARWCKAATRMPVIVKLTPNITDIRYPARAAKKGGADAVSLINTINSITNVDLDTFAPEPTIDGKGSHGGYCGPAVKPIALSMVSEIARDEETRGLPISGIGGITTWRDAAEFMALGAGTVQVCTAAMTYGFRIVEEMIAGLSRYLDEKQHDARRSRRPRRAERHRLAVPQPQLRHQGAHRPGPLHRVRPLPHRLRGHLAPGDHRDQGWRAPFRGDRQRMRRLQSLRQCLPGRGLHHHGAAHRRRRPAHRRAGDRLPQLDRSTRTTRWRSPLPASRRGCPNRRSSVGRNRRSRIAPFSRAGQVGAYRRITPAG